MGLFRKKETYNEQMLREAGLDRVVFNTPQPAPAAEPVPVLHPLPVADDVPLGALHGSARGRLLAWDAVRTVNAPGIHGDHVEFTALPNGDLVIGDDSEPGDLCPLADAIEDGVSPPYKATASRQDGDLWGVGAKQIEVEQFSFPDADALELSQSNGVAELRADGVPSDVTVPVTLQRLGERTGGDFCVEAQRIDGDDWEVKVSPL